MEKRTIIASDQETQTGFTQETVKKLYIGLVHYPVLNKNGETVQTSVTNLDIHDIARSASTYGVKSYFIITPDTTQQAYISKITVFWQSETGNNYNAKRSRALSIITLSNSIQDSINKITMQETMQPIVITTTAKPRKEMIPIMNVGKMTELNKPLFILFGTGHGLTEEIHNKADLILEPITGIGDYNHLSVRSAVAIILDRITSRCI